MTLGATLATAEVSARTSATASPRPEKAVAACYGRSATCRRMQLLLPDCRITLPWLCSWAECCAPPLLIPDLRGFPFEQHAVE
eukprot:6194348-Pleurochrysis_carterae.AAC.3